MQSRGPDDDGEWYSEDNRVGLGHRRLSIIDLSKQAAQPMTSQCGRYVISYNGEIYNYKSLRAGLERAGTRFATDSDTEVVLEMFGRYGTDMFNHLRGMYALAIWDTLERRMLLARDPFGIKPLYYADDGWTCRVASQVKALRAIGQISDDPEPAGHVGFLLFGSVPEPFTLWREIRAVPAGTYVWVDRSGIGAPRKYFDLPALYECDSAGSTDDSLSEAIEDSVRHHMVADVPVGAFLSSGLDSSVLVAMMSKCATAPIRTVTVGFEEFRGTSADEVPLAEEVASAFNTQHTTRLVSREEFQQDLPKILDAMDQPTIDGINIWFASKACAEIGLKVAVSGLGGDEISAGYPTFRVLPNWYRRTRFAGKIPGLGSMLRGILAPLRPITGINAKAVGMLEYGGSLAGLYLLKRGLFMPWELPDLVGRELAREGLKRLDPLENLERSGYRNADTPGARISVLEQSCYMRNQLLRDADWASMAHSLEVRVPFVDPALQRQVFRHGRPTSKSEIANVSSLLPKAMLTRQKSGFETPVENWISKCGIESKTPQATEHWSRRWARSINQHFGDGCAFSH